MFSGFLHIWNFDVALHLIVAIDGEIETCSQHEIERSIH